MWGILGTDVKGVVAQIKEHHTCVTNALPVHSRYKRERESGWNFGFGLLSIECVAGGSLFFTGLAVRVEVWLGFVR
jgi:hypothetical protein